MIPEGYELIEVESIRNAGIQETFDIEVETDHEFIANGMVSHNCLGKYHPHGDMSCYQAMCKMTNCNEPLIDGTEANFGDMYEPPAAMRYCVTGNTFLYTKENGMLRVKDIIKHKPSKLKAGYKLDISDKNITTQSLNSEEKEISHWIYSGKHKVLRIETENAPPIECTPNHPFLVVTNTEFKWVEAKDLTDNDYVCTTSKSCDSIKFSISKEEAELLGLIIGDGWVTKNCIGFNNTNKMVNNRYRKLALEFLSKDVKERITNNEDRKVYRSLEINNTELIKWFEDKYDVPPGNSRMRFIPKYLFSQPKEVVFSFLSGLYESEGTISKEQVCLSSSSLNLCKDVQNILMGYLNIRATISYDHEENKTYKLHISGVNQRIEFLKNVKLISKTEKDRSQKVLNAVIAITAGNSKRDIIPFVDKKYDCDYEVHKTRSKFKNMFFSYSKEMQEKYKHHIEGGYIYSKVKSIKKLKNKKHVYDLTVPDTHAFTANGYIVHNTETKLTKFCDNVLLDPDYLACIPTVKNFDGEFLEPLYLPSKLPNILINGNEGIATGCTCFIPSFTLESVKNLVIKAIKKKVTTSICYNNLDFGFYYGGTEYNGEEELKEYFKTGKGSIYFIPEYEELDNGISLVSLAPRFNIEKKIPQLENNPDVKSVIDKSEGDTIKIDIIFKAEKATGAKREEIIESIEDTLKTYISSSLIVTERQESGTATYSISNISKLINYWVKWRLSFEKKVLIRLRDIQKEKLSHQELLLLAVDSRKIIIESLNSKDPESVLVKKLKIKKIDAITILNLQVRRLAKMGKDPIVAKIKQHKKEIKILNKELKDIPNRVINQIKDIS